MRSVNKVIAILSVLFAVNTATAATATKSSSPDNVYSEDKTAVMVSPKEPEFVIRMRSNPTTGYSWFLRYYDSDLIQPVKHSFEHGDKKLIGAPGYDVWHFRVKPAGFVVPMQTQIRFVYARPWEMNEGGKQVMFQVTTQGKESAE